MKRIVYVMVIAVSLTSCVSKKKYLDATSSRDKVQLALNQTTADLAECEKKFGYKSKDYDNIVSQLENERKKAEEWQSQVEYWKKQNTNLLQTLSDLSVISKTGAETIQKSLGALIDQNNQLRSRDSLNLALSMNLKRSLDNINDSDVNIEVQKGVVLISLSDKMLYKSGSAEILPAANTVLDKIAKVINDYKAYDVLIEGNTDNVPISTACFPDNWDLSTKRATVVARYLQTKAGVSPGRLIAAGRSEYNPKVANDTPENKSINRRTEIVIMPRLDEFFQLLQTPK